MITTGLLMPTLHLNTYGSYFGKLTGQVSPMNPMQFPETNSLYPTGMLNATLLWKVPIGRFIYGGRVKKYNARIQIQKLHLNRMKAEICEEIMVAQKNIQLSKEQMTILQAGSQCAEKALNQSIERQKIGTACPFEIFQAQEFFIQAQLDYLEAVANFNKGQYALEVARGEDL